VAYLVVMGLVPGSETDATVTVVQAWVPLAEAQAGATLTIDGAERGAAFGLLDAETGEPVVALLATGGSITFDEVGALVSASVSADFAPVEIEPWQDPGDPVQVPSGPAQLEVLGVWAYCQDGAEAEQAQLEALTVDDLGGVSGPVTLDVEGDRLITISGPTIAGFLGQDSLTMERGYQSSDVNTLGMSIEPVRLLPDGFTTDMQAVALDLSGGSPALGGMAIQGTTTGGQLCAVGLDVMLIW
jgi:hypothetical protein